MPSAHRDWELWSTHARLVVTDPAALPAAVATVDSMLAEVDAAASRFRGDSELRSLHAGRNRLSPLLARLIAESVAAAEFTDGLVDPTVGAAVRSWGYDRDITLIRADGPRPPAAVVRRVPGWRRLRLTGDVLHLPAGVELDLGAVAKAVAADRCAAAVAEIGVGALVSLGGDIATAGETPDGGWLVDVRDGPDEPADAIRLHDGTALATSSTLRRAWRRDGERVHHIIDPRTGGPAGSPWRTVTVAAPTCAMANAGATASIVRGARATTWLEDLGLPARLVDLEGREHWTSPWPRVVAA